MPWKELCTMEVRERFVLRARDGAKIAPLCREFGISRKTAYKWLKRYEERGLEGLESLDRRPHGSPLGTTAEMVAEVVAVRRAHPTWGARKLAEVLARRFGAEAPAERTVARILVRTGMVQPMRRAWRRASAGVPPPQPKVLAPNDLWTVDFKGWWLAGKERCEPLTVRDAFSRFVLAIDVLPGTHREPVQELFEKLFERYGLPKAIQTDNGTPFVSAHGTQGLTRLGVFWLSLGIEHIRSRPATPSDNGGHERMHRDMAAELERFSALSRRAQQEACDRWRHDFNTHRPHEALGMKTPDEVYVRSRVHYRRAPAEPTYPEQYQLRRVGSAGSFKHQGQRYFVSHALAQKTIGLAPTDQPHTYDVWFARKRLGSIDFSRQQPHVEAVTS